MTIRDVDPRYRDGWGDAMAALLVAASGAVERLEATAATFDDVEGSAAESCARLLRASAQAVTNVVADVQTAQVEATS